jgi:epoxyqueuosine reductase
MSAFTKKYIRDLLISEGFSLVGFLHKDDCHFGDWISAWLDNGFHSEMTWMEQYQSIRNNPSIIEPYTKSVISAAFNYKSAPPEAWKGRNPISNYAWGEDYHVVLRKKLVFILRQFEKEIPGFKGRACIDTAPIPEKIIAYKSGLGWIGKNSLLINRHFGSYLFLVEIICNQEFTSEKSAKDYCGTCRKCIDACPTKAIVEDGIIDSNRCISYLTIEKRGAFSEKEESFIDYQLFGCDICQQVCPWNKKSPLSSFSPFQCSDKWVATNLASTHSLTQEEFELLKIKSPVKRAKFSGFLRNLQAVSSKRSKPDQ